MVKDVICWGFCDEQINKPKIYKFQEDRSLDMVKDDQFPGFLLARIILFGGNA